MSSKIKELAEQTKTEVPTATVDWLRIPIPNSPFWAIGRDHEFWITMGKYRLNQEMLEIAYLEDAKEEHIRARVINVVSDWLDYNKWDVMAKVVAVMNNDFKQSNQ